MTPASAMKYTRANDRCTPESATVRPEPEELKGTWFNTDPGTGEIEKVVIAITNGSVRIRAFGAQAPEPLDWGEAQATPYVDRIGSSCVTGFLR